MASQIRNFLNKHKKSKDSNDNHTNTNLLEFRGRFIIRKGSYIIEDKDYDRFLKIYVTAKDVKYKFGFTEVPKKVSALVFDFDLDLHTESCAKDVRESKVITNLIKEFQDALKTLFYDINDEALVLFKNEARLKKDGTVRYGLHLHFPHLHLTFPQKKIARNELLDLCQKTFFMTKMKELCKPKDLDEVIDACVTEPRMGWMIYGCEKENSKPYQIYYVVKDGVKMDVTYKFNFKTVKMLSLRIPNLKPAKNTPKGSLMIAGLETRKKSIKQTIAQVVSNDDGFTFIVKPKFNSSQSVTIEKLERVLNECLSKCPEICVKRILWFKVGVIIKNHFSGSDGLALYDRFSQHCPEKYDSKAVIKNWKVYRCQGTPNIGTLYYWINNGTS